MQHSSFSRFFLVDLFPFCHGNFFGSVASPKPSKAILEYPCLMLKQALVFRAFCANIESHRGLV